MNRKVLITIETNEKVAKDRIKRIVKRQAKAYVKSKLIAKNDGHEIKKIVRQYCTYHKINDKKLIKNALKNVMIEKLAQKVKKLSDQVQHITRERDQQANTERQVQQNSAIAFPHTE